MPICGLYMSTDACGPGLHHRTKYRSFQAINPGLGLVDWHEHAAQPNGRIRAVSWMTWRASNRQSPEVVLAC